MVLSKIKGFFQNKWTKRCVSIFSPALAVVVVILAYMSLVYTINITNFKNFAITIGVFVGVLGIVMIYTRKTFLTSLISMITLPLLLPIVINYWGTWILIVPITVLCVLMFFLCGASENLKTVLGTIYITFFILGTVAYLLYNTLIVAQTKDTQSEFYVSENGNYRCYVIDTIDSSTGSTKVYVEPNTYDINYNGISFVATGYEKIVYNIRERKPVKIEWRKDNLFVDNELRFRSSDAEENEWFVFMDYKTRINKTTLSGKKLCNTVSKKFLGKPIFDIPEQDEDTSNTPIDDTQDTTTTTPSVTTTPTVVDDNQSNDESTTSSDDAETTTTDDNSNNDDTTTTTVTVTTTGQNIYEDYFN